MTTKTTEKAAKPEFNGKAIYNPKGNTSGFLIKEKTIKGGRYHL